MKKLLLTAVMAVLAGCTASQSPGYSSSSGSLALSRDEKYLYAVDTDNGILGVVELSKNQVIAQVPVGAGPERVHVSADDTIYVSNRANRSVSVIARDSWQEKARIPVGVEPVGLASSPDGKTLYVVNSTTLATPDQGSVMAIDTATQRVLWEQTVGNEPRGIRLVNANTAAITLYKSGVVFLELNNQGTGQVTPLADATNTALSVTKNGGSSAGLPTPTGLTAPSSFISRSVTDVTVSPDGQRVYATGLLARQDPIALPPSVFHAYYDEGGPCNLGSVAGAGLFTFDANQKQPKVDDLTSCSYSSVSSTADFPPTSISTNDPARPVQGAYVSAVDPTNSFIFVVNRESNNVAVMSTSSRDTNTSFTSSGVAFRALVTVGNAPNGIALSSDGRTAWVYNSFDHTISTLVQDNSTSPASVKEANPTGRIQVTGNAPGVPDQVLKGRILFFAAYDARMSKPNVAVSCNTCHTEGGREDGHIWGFPDGPRNTPSLAGRMIAQTAPYHWTGEFPDLGSFLDHTVQARMGGTGLGQTEHDELNAYVASLVLPDSPTRLATPTAAQVRGAQLFAQAQCGSCHSGVTMTSNAFANVGTLGGNPSFTNDTMPAQGFNIPSLLGLARTAPFLHDGSALTLIDRINMDRNSTDPNVQNIHGHLQGISDSQVSDLVAYLQSL